MPTQPSDSLRDALVQRAWAQWIALGVSAVGSAEENVIDPEALVSLTADLGDADARLRDTSIDWCSEYGRYVNTTRLRRVLDEVGTGAQAIGEYAATVAAAGGPRWPMASDPRPGYRSRGKARLEHLDSTPRLNLRLRAAFGVNARADVLAALALRPGITLTLADLARITRFTKRNVALTVDALALAGMLELESVGNERRVILRRERIQPWLPTQHVEPVDWIDRFTVGVATLRFLDAHASTKPNVRDIEARRLVRTLHTKIRQAALPQPDMQRLGESFREAFSEWVAHLTAALGTTTSGSRAVRDAESARAIASFLGLELDSTAIARLTGLSSSTLHRMSRGEDVPLPREASRHLLALSTFVDEAGDSLERMVGRPIAPGGAAMRNWLTHGWVRTSRGRMRPIEALANHELAIEALHELRQAME